MACMLTAAALASPTTGGSTYIGNTPFDRDDFFKKMREFGKAHGAGANSRPAAARMAVEAAKTLPNVGYGDAEELWIEFQKASAKARALEYKEEGSFKVQVSKFRQFLALGAMPSVDGLAVFERATDVISRLSKVEPNPLKGSAYDNLVNIARAQLKQEGTEMDDAAIEALLTASPEGKTDLDKLADAYKRAKVLNDGSEQGPGFANPTLASALEMFAQAITELGGELPPTTKEDAARARVAKLAMKLGMSLAA